MTAGALASWYLARQNDADDAAPVELDSPQRGYYLKSARILGTGSDGGLLYEIQAKHAEQRGDDEIAFTDVLINYSPASEVPWIVNADAALISQGERRVRLSGHVRALSSEGFSGSDTEIRTEYLELDPGALSGRNRPARANSDRRTQPDRDRHASIAEGESLATHIQCEREICTLKRLFLACLLLLPGLLVAQLADLRLPISLDADSTDWDGKSSMLMFRGLRLSQGKIGVAADEGRASKLDFQDSVWRFSGQRRYRCRRRPYRVQLGRPAVYRPYACDAHRSRAHRQRLRCSGLAAMK